MAISASLISSVMVFCSSPDRLETPRLIVICSCGWFSFTVGAYVSGNTVDVVQDFKSWNLDGSFQAAAHIEHHFLSGTVDSFSEAKGGDPHTYHRCDK